jgi:hypothetical protein
MQSPPRVNAISSDRCAHGNGASHETGAENTKHTRFKISPLKWRANKRRKTAPGCNEETNFVPNLGGEMRKAPSSFETAHLEAPTSGSTIANESSFTHFSNLLATFKDERLLARSNKTGKKKRNWAQLNAW